MTQNPETNSLNRIAPRACTLSVSLQSVTICAHRYGRAEMGHFQALPDVVAVAADRLVVIVSVDDDGGGGVPDLANGGLSTTSASELSAPQSL